MGTLGTALGINGHGWSPRKRPLSHVLPWQTWYFQVKWYESI